MTNGWGPVERDRSNGEFGESDGATLTLNGTTFAKGLGAHAFSDVRYGLGGTCSTFTATVGVDDEAGSLGSVVFQVFVDGVVRYNSGVMTGATASNSVSVSLTGANELRLVVTDAGDGAASDHADWADARIACTP
jgi:alpha-galactosidase